MSAARQLECPPYLQQLKQGSLPDVRISLSRNRIAQPTGGAPGLLHRRRTCNKSCNKLGPSCPPSRLVRRRSNISHTALSEGPPYCSTPPVLEPPPGCFVPEPPPDSLS